MTIRGVLYVVVATLAVASAAAASIALYRDGSGSVPGWTRFVNPGPLSGKHAFLSETCESCHAPAKGVDAAACISCHAPSAADLGKQRNCGYLLWSVFKPNTLARQFYDKLGGQEIAELDWMTLKV